MLPSKTCTATSVETKNMSLATIALLFSSMSIPSISCLDYLGYYNPDWAPTS
jgi:hypothetical protein